MTQSSRLVCVTQPYVPAYREPLFEAIHRLLDAGGVELQVWASHPGGEQALRGDSISRPWMRTLKSRQLSIAGRVVNVRFAPREMRSADLVVSELEALNTLAWALPHRIPLVLWGHGKSYVGPPNPFGDRIEWSLAARARHIMTYAPSGADYLVSAGSIPANKVTAIGNSTDSARLRSLLTRLEQDAVKRVRCRHELSDGPTALFVGGIDSSKRIDFVLEAYRAAKSLDPATNLIVAGSGAQASTVAECAERLAGLRYVPRANPHELAEFAAVSDAVWMPGRVGLVAVDALAVGLPVHTTRFAFHAPEIEFLRDSEVEYLPNDPKQFARDSLRLMSSSVRWPERQLRNDIPSIDKVAEQFTEVVFAELERNGR